MKEHKKYTDIVRLGHKSTYGVLNVGDYITVTEKIDGANASFMLDSDSECGVTSYSRNQTLDDNKNLNGFYFWVIENVVPKKNILNPNYRYYGEWLCPHKVKYKRDAYKNFYLFSIWDEENCVYLPDADVREEAEKLNIRMPECFYEGDYISFEHLKLMVGKSNITEVENTGEGIVVKNHAYRDRQGRQIFVKLVSDSFAEIQKQKKPTDTSIYNKLNELVLSVLTENRVEKILLKKVDDGILNPDFGIEDMGVILKIITSEIFNDCMKEEKEIFEDVEIADVRKTFGKLTPSVVKEVLNKR